ncbi:MAG: beta-lactamase family protein [Bacteroidales bacterium]|nr:beta-lactamase family protein [Bacteroidales bacterium]
MPPTRREMLAVTGALATAATVPATRVLAASPRPTTQAVAYLPHAKPEDLGLNRQQLQVAYDLLESWTHGPQAPVPGGAILVGRKGQIVPPRFFGRMGSEPDAEKIRPDAMFLMASITKPIVYLSAIMLVEQGKLNLSDRVTRYIPEFQAHGKDAVRVRHLFTHTSGLPDMLTNNEQLRREHAPLQRFLDCAARDTELLFPPGTRVSYQSMGTALVAEIVQRLSGKSIIAFLRERIFTPLGLKSIGLGAQGFDPARLVRVQVPDYQKGSDFGWNSDYWRNLGAPWGGLFAAPEDFAVLCQVMLANGSHQGVRLLSPASVRAMTTNRLAEYPELPEVYARAQPWGLGWRLNHPGTADSWGDLLGPRVFGHTGATGTMVWMDPDTGGFCLLLTNALRAAAPWRLVHLSNAIAAAFEK